MTGLREIVERPSPLDAIRELWEYWFASPLEIGSGRGGASRAPSGVLPEGVRLLYEIDEQYPNFWSSHLPVPIERLTVDDGRMAFLEEFQMQDAWGYDPGDSGDDPELWMRNSNVDLPELEDCPWRQWPQRLNEFLRYFLLAELCRYSREGPGFDLDRTEAARILHGFEPVLEPWDQPLGPYYFHAKGNERLALRTKSLLVVARRGLRRGSQS